MFQVHTILYTAKRGLGLAVMVPEVVSLGWDNTHSAMQWILLAFLLGAWQSCVTQAILFVGLSFWCQCCLGCLHPQSTKLVPQLDCTWYAGGQLVKQLVLIRNCCNGVCVEWRPGIWGWCSLRIYLADRSSARLQTLWDSRNSKTHIDESFGSCCELRYISPVLSSMLLSKILRPQATVSSPLVGGGGGTSQITIAKWTSGSYLHQDAQWFWMNNSHTKRNYWICVTTVVRSVENFAHER